MRLNKKLGIIMLNQDWKIGLSLIISVKKLLKNLRKELSISRKLKSMHKGLIGYCLAMTVKTLFTKDFRRTWLKMAANVLCMSSGTCIHFQIRDTACVPLLIHGVVRMCLFIN